jgi:tRNA (guanine37-N1)-methyltransferase
MRVDVVSIFPDYLDPLRLSLVGKAIDAGRIALSVHDLRDWTTDRHRTVDDTPYGGGPGMVMRPEPWGAALDTLVPAAGEGTADGAVPRLVIPTPAGRPFTQAVAEEYAAEEWLLFACGRYEGIDARVDEVCIGDYVLAGGEAAVLVIVEAMARLLPGVLGNAESAPDDSFSSGRAGLLEGPVFTKPPTWRGLAVPDVLLSGNHAAIADWREAESRARTARVRPDLLPG